jgi:guanidinoacetate N-methyltransferase
MRENLSLKIKDWGDARDETKLQRTQIGFPAIKEQWQFAVAHYSTSKLCIAGHPVMEDWEDGYMKVLAQIAARRKGRILEVGFGMGISARHIQDCQPEEHVIIEANREVFGRLEQFSRQATYSVRPVFGFWEDTVESFSDGCFDGILFDTYPLTDAEVHKNHFCFFAQAYRLLRPGGCLTYYSDEPQIISADHLSALEGAGFSRKGISYRMVRVNPPVNCQYWKFSTIVAPVVIKI